MQETTRSMVTRIQSRLRERARRTPGAVWEQDVNDLRDALNDLLDLTGLLLSLSAGLPSSPSGPPTSSGSRRPLRSVRSSPGLPDTGYQSSGVITANTLRGLR